MIDCACAFLNRSVAYWITLFSVSPFLVSIPCTLWLCISTHWKWVYFSTPWLRTQHVTYFDKWVFSQCAANKDIKCVVISRFALLHFCHNYQNKPHVDCWLQEDEIHMKYTCPNQPTDLQSIEELSCQLIDSRIWE